MQESGSIKAWETQSQRTYLSQINIGSGTRNLTLPNRKETATILQDEHPEMETVGNFKVASVLSKLNQDIQNCEVDLRPTEVQ